LALVAVGASTAASAAFSEPAPTAIEQQLEAEIEGMVESGLDEDDAKVEMVEEQLEAIEDGAGELAHERGVDTGAMIAAAEAEDDAAAAAEARVAAGDEFGWESGTVPCEPVPGLLPIEELTGATCLSVPQPDGTGRYVAVGPDGVVRSVRFGSDGDVHRLDDTHMGGPPAPGATLAPTPQGDVQVAPPGGAPATVDVP
jgi:hypothetical protein